MIKAIHGGNMPVLLDIKTKDGGQIFRGEVYMREGSFVDSDVVKVRITEEAMNFRYICEIEVQ